MISVKRNTRTPYPPIGSYISTPAPAKTFKAVQILDNFIPRPLRPAGARQPESEANILSKMKAKVNHLAPANWIYL